MCNPYERFFGRVAYWVRIKMFSVRTIWALSLAEETKFVKAFPVTS